MPPVQFRRQRRRIRTRRAAMAAVAELLGVSTTETVRKWVRHAEG